MTAAERRTPYRTWYRALLPDGRLWCESTEPDQVAQQSAGRRGLRFEKTVVELVEHTEPWDGKP